MHEFSLAQGLHSQLVDLVDEHGSNKVLKAEVSIGKDAGIVVESFTFGFDVVAGQHKKTEGMKLEIIDDDSKDIMLQRVELE